MKKIPLVAALALVIAGAGATALASGPAGDRGPGERGPERMIERLKEDLKLDDKQAAQVKQVFEQERQKHEAAHEEARQALAKILTPEQLKQLEAHRPHGPGDREGRGDRGPRDRGPGEERGNDRNDTGGDRPVR